MDYKDYNDNELLDYISESNEEANDILFEKYKPLIEKIAKKFYEKMNKGLGLELNDLIQEGMIALNNAIKSFDSSKDILFYTFAKTCIERKMVSTILTAKRQKNKILNDSVPIEYDNGDEIVSLDYLIKDTDINPENIVINLEEQKELIEKTKEVLTPFEEEVFLLKLEGFEYKEIASILDKEPKNIDNAIQRIKNKIRKLINENK